MTRKKDTVVESIEGKLIDLQYPEIGHRSKKIGSRVASVHVEMSSPSGVRFEWFVVSSILRDRIVGLAQTNVLLGHTYIFQINGSGEVVGFTKVEK
jgi:hypothetical protein